MLPNGNLFVGGDFNNLTGNPLVSNIGIWDGTRWRGTGLGFEDDSTGFLGADGYAVAVNPQGQVFVGGEFEYIGGAPYSRIAMWDGTNWNNLGAGVDGDVSALVIRGDDLYVGGSFSNAGGITAVRVARYNMRTKTWSALGSGLPNGYVNAFAFVGNTLYAGGGGFPAQTECCLWKFDGTTWSPFSQKYITREFRATFTQTAVRALASDGQRLLVGGYYVDLYPRANPDQRINANNLFVYDPRDDSIALFGDGTDATTGVANGKYGAVVRAITIAGDGIYIGGEFTSINTVAALNIARLDANGWSALGTGTLDETPENFDEGVSTIAQNGADLYVGGKFSTAGVQAFNIAKWSTQSRSWSALGDCGITRNAESVSIERVASIVIQPAGLPNAGLYAAGGILAAGCEPSTGFAAWYGVGGGGNAPLTPRAFVPLIRR